MKKAVYYLTLVFLAMFLITPTTAFAKKDGNPSGWTKGEKEGWDGEALPPGLFKKEGEEAKKKAEKASKKAEKEAKKKGKKGKHEAKKTKEKAEKEVEEKEED